MTRYVTYFVAIELIFFSLCDIEFFIGRQLAKEVKDHPSNAFSAQTDAHATYDKLVWIEAIPGSEVNRLLLIESLEN